MTSSSEANEPTQPGWVSQVSIAWVLDDAPCPTDLLPVLVAIARRCDNNGTGSYQSKPTLAKKTGKSRDQVDADVKKLLELGLIRLGDQTLPERNGVPAGQWPVVYDVALELRGPKPAKAGRNKEGKNKGGKAKDAGAPGTGTTPGTDTGGGTDTPGTPGMGTSPTPGMGTPQISPPKNPPKNPSSLSARTAVPPPRDPADDRERDDSATPEDPNHDERHQWVIEAGCPPHLACAVVDHLEDKYRVEHIGWWKHCHRTGDIPARVREALAALAAGPADRDRQDRSSERQENANSRNARGWLDIDVSPTPSRSPRRIGSREEPPPGHQRRPDGSLVLTDSRDPNINWDDWPR